MYGGRLSPPLYRLNGETRQRLQPGSSQRERKHKKDGIATSPSVTSKIRLVARRTDERGTPLVMISSDSTFYCLQAVRRLT